MAKLCPRGKAAAKRKYKGEPWETANMYATTIRSGNVTPGVKKKKKKKAMGGGMMRDSYRVGGLARRKRMGCA